jgi:5'-nucleotidase
VDSIRTLRRGTAAALGGALAVGTLVAPPVVAAQSATESADQPAATAPVDVTLLNVNDYHGRIAASRPSTVAFADTLEKLRAQYGGAEKTAFLSAGDNVGASLFASAFKDDQPTIDVLNAMDLKASAVGNHEFDKGIADLTDRIIPAADFDYLGANVTVDGTPMQEYSLVEVNGLTVGVVGVVTEETPTLVNPALIRGVEFGDPVEAVNRVEAQLSDGDAANGEADVVVAEYHAGSPTSESLEAGRAQLTTFDDIVGETSGHVDAIFTAHTHQLYAWEGPQVSVENSGTGSLAGVLGSSGSSGSSTGSLGGSLDSFGGGDDAAPAAATRPIIQSGSYGSPIGRVTLSVDPQSRSVTGFTQENVLVPSSADGADLTNPVVSEVKRIVDATLAEADVVGSQPVGTVTDHITTAFRDGNRDDRLSESTLGNLVADFMVEAVAERGGADIGFMNPGGVRAELMNDPAGQDGNINKAEANGVLPFANTLVTLELTGAQVKTVLEQQWQPAGADRPFLALGTNSDLTWTYDPTRPAGDRITSITLRGEPIDPAATYRVATASFLAGGGDNFTEFANASNVRDTGLVDSEAWQAYLTAHRAEGLSPDFGRHAVAAKDLSTTVTAGGEVTFTVTDLDLTSLGTPHATTATAAFDGTELGAFPVTTGADLDTFGAGAHPVPLDGRAVITVTIPAGATPGAHTLTVTTDTGTVVTIPVTVG